MAFPKNPLIPKIQSRTTTSGRRSVRDKHVGSSQYIYIGMLSQEIPNAKTAPPARDVSALDPAPGRSGYIKVKKRPIIVARTD